MALSLACTPNTGPVVIPPAAANMDDSVGPGDKLDIQVKGHEDLTGEFDVAADGSVRFPRIGKVAAAGRHPAEIAAEIETMLADGWLRDPQVTVLVSERQNPDQVTVLGAVKDPNSYAHDGDLTFMKALSLAGGLTTEAQRKKVSLIRETQAGRQTFVIDVQAIVESRAKDFPVEPGDVIVVPESPI